MKSGVFSRVGSNPAGRVFPDCEKKGTDDDVSRDFTRLRRACPCVLKRKGKCRRGRERPFSAPLRGVSRRVRPIFAQFSPDPRCSAALLHQWVLGWGPAGALAVFAQNARVEAREAVFLRGARLQRANTAAGGTGGKVLRGPAWVRLAWLLHSWLPVLRAVFWSFPGAPSGPLPKIHCTESGACCDAPYLCFLGKTRTFEREFMTTFAGFSRACGLALMI